MITIITLNNKDHIANHKLLITEKMKIMKNNEEITIAYEFKETHY